MASVSVDPERKSPSFSGLLSDPRVDRTVAVIASIPTAYLLYVRLRLGTLDIVRINLMVQSLLLIITMVARRAPVRVTPNPWFWLLAFVATYGATAAALFAQRGVPLAPAIVTSTIALLALGITVFARFSLGRNIGFVPAQRRLVTSGAYAYMRHPIYTGIFVGYMGLILRAYSPLNLAMFSVIAALFMIKSVVEENFLKTDPLYAAYMQLVPFRWFPGIA